MITKAISIFQDNENGFAKAWILWVISEVDKTDRDDVIAKASLLFRDKDNGKDRSDILKQVAAIDKADRDDVIEKASPLFRDKDNEKDRGHILQGLAAVDKADRDDVIDKAKVVVEKLKEASSKAKVLELLAPMDKDDRTAVIAELTPLISARDSEDEVESKAIQANTKLGIFYPVVVINEVPCMNEVFGINEDFTLECERSFSTNPFSPLSKDVPRLWIYKNELPEDFSDTEKGYKVQPWDVTPGDDFIFLLDLRDVTGRLGLGIVDSNGKSLLKPEPAITTDGLKTFTLQIPEGVTGVTPLIYCSQGPLRFTGKYFNVRIK